MSMDSSVKRGDITILEKKDWYHVPLRVDLCSSADILDGLTPEQVTLLSILNALYL
jgi:hypothetical protein